MNHSCEPNAVVVFPKHGSSSPPQRCKLHVVALRDISPGEEVLISYVDLAATTGERQRVLKERYLVECQCGLCMKRDWIDPREAMWCQQKGCVGWVGAPDWGEADQDTPDIETGACNLCGRRSCIADPAQVYERIEASASLAKCVTNADADTRPAGATYGVLREAVHWSSALFPPSHNISWMLIYAAHVQAIELATLGTDEAAGLWEDATIMALFLCAGMQARGDPRDPRSAIYPPGHPIRAVLLATLGKLLAHEPGAPPAHMPPVVTRPVSVPQARAPRLKIARAVLTQALSEARIGFGRESDVAAQVRDTLEATDIELGL